MDEAEKLLADELAVPLIQTETYAMSPPRQGMVVRCIVGDHRQPDHTSLQSIEILDTAPLSEEQEEVQQKAFRLIGTICNTTDVNLVDFMGITVGGNAFMGTAPYEEEIKDQLYAISAAAKSVDYNANNVDYDPTRDGPSIEEVAALAGSIISFLYLKGVNHKAAPDALEQLFLRGSYQDGQAD